MLTRVELRYFKCFDLLRLPIAPLTLLTGLNASGKSSVLQSIVLLHQTMREHEWSTRLVLNGSGVRLGTASDVAGRTGFEIALEDDDSVYRWEFGGARQDMSMEARLVAVNDRTFKMPPGATISTTTGRGRSRLADYRSSAESDLHYRGTDSPPGGLSS